jgi:hypothetical protein
MNENFLPKNMLFLKSFQHENVFGCVLTSVPENCFKIYLNLTYRSKMYAHQNNFLT